MASNLIKTFACGGNSEFLPSYDPGTIESHSLLYSSHDNFCPKGTPSERFKKYFTSEAQRKSYTNCF